MATFQEILQASVADQKRRQEQERFASAWFFWRWPYRGRILTDGPRLFAPQEAGFWQARIELEHQGSRIYRYIWARGAWLLDLRTGQEILAASYLKSTSILPTVAQIQSGVKFSGTEAAPVIGWEWWDKVWGPSDADKSAEIAARERKAADADDKRRRDADVAERERRDAEWRANAEKADKESAQLKADYDAQRKSEDRRLAQRNADYDARQKRDKESSWWDVILGPQSEASKKEGARLDAARLKRDELDAARRKIEAAKYKKIDDEAKDAVRREAEKAAKEAAKEAKRRKALGICGIQRQYYFDVDHYMAGGIDTYGNTNKPKYSFTHKEGPLLLTNHEAAKLEAEIAKQIPGMEGFYKRVRRMVYRNLSWERDRRSLSQMAACSSPVIAGDAGGSTLEDDLRAKLPEV